jgi:hypothetical protein
MNINIRRQWYTPRSVSGELDIDGNFQCYTLEDRPRLFKIPGETCIDAGVYNVIITPSSRFSEQDGSPKLLPLLENVPNFSGIRIHSGNTDKHTEGCILVGMVREENKVYESRTAFIFLFSKIKTALECGEKVTITIKDIYRPIE